MEADRIEECPTGLVVRETPHLYDAIGLCVQIYNGADTVRDQTHWLKQIYYVWAAEHDRYEEMRRERRGFVSDSEYGLAVRRGDR